MFRQKIARLNSSSGMSLVELIVVMAILSIVMMAVFSLYIPAHQSTVAQTQVSDVQDNLRLALKTMSRDILNAGFLAPNNPIHNTATNTPSSDFTIDTRIVGNNFARITNTANGTGKITLTVSDPDMVANFPEDSFVRIFEPINAEEVRENPIQASVNDDDRVYTVDSFGADTVVIDISSNSTLDAADILPESVLVRVASKSAPPMQTIRYRLNNDSLERIINGTSTQVLARNIDTNIARSNFVSVPNDNGKVHRVDIKLTGKTTALKNDAISGEKIRSVETSVKLRNVF